MYNFTFANVGGSTRVSIRTADDLRHLGELDQKLWTVLSCPVIGLEIEEQSLRYMDLDGDGLIHVNEVVATAQWLCSVLHHPDSLFLHTDHVEVDNIADDSLRAIAERLGTADLVTLDNALGAINIDEQAAPEAPYSLELIDGFRAKKDEYASYFAQERMARAGLATIAEDTPRPGMSEAEFIKMGEQIAAYDTACQAVQEANTALLEATRLQYEPIRRLLMLHRDFVTLLRNYVTLEDFYSMPDAQELLGQDRLFRTSSFNTTDHTGAIFQAGTLVIDQRACHLCIRIDDKAKQEAQAPQSGIFLLFCDCHSRKLNRSISILAAVTVGDIRNLKEGKNAIFYDRHGNDYDATVTKIIDNPISISQAFWSPYRKLSQWLTDLINKSASEKNDKVLADMQNSAQNVNVTTPNDDAKKQAFDIAKFAGIFAAIGMALGYIGAFITDLAKGINTLPWWQLLIWIAGILLVISGPAMILAWIKLRRRNLAPILNANGWAVNADAIISVPFGVTLTDQAQFPLLKLVDPFAKPGMPSWKKWLITLSCLVVAVGLLLLIVYLTGNWPFGCSAQVAEQAVEMAIDTIPVAQ